MDNFDVIHNLNKEQFARFLTNITSCSELSCDECIVKHLGLTEFCGINSFDGMYNFLNRDNKIKREFKYEIKAYGSLCSLQTFTINGKEAYYDDFGEKEDMNPRVAEDYGCGDMQFIPRPATKEVLDKYDITVDEYNEICEELVDALSFGCCGWCV